MRINKYNTLKGNNNIPQLVKEMSTNYKVCDFLDSPNLIYNMMCDVFHTDRQTEEICYLLCLNNKHKLQGIFEISRGTVNTSLMSPREIFIKALLCGAVNIVIVHNHPSGDTSPSKEDIETTKKIKESGSLIGIPLLDHIIIGDNFYSMLENGFI